MNIQLKNTTINYTKTGEGNTLVLLHGFTESLEIWDDFVHELSNHYRVISIDLPGHGKSSCVAEVHTMDLMADCVKQVLDNIKVENCVMIGHSMGGYVILAFADKYPQMLKGFGLFHSSAASDTEEGKKNRSRAIEIIKQNHHNFLASFIPDLFTPENRIKHSLEIEKLVEAAKSMTMEGVVAAQEGMLVRVNRYKTLENSTVPVLFIAGQKDSRIPFSKVMEQVSLPPESYLLSLREVAHMGYIEAREETLGFIKSFLGKIYK